MQIHDLVTDVDRACEVIISQKLLGAFPDHLMLGEEGMTQGAAGIDRDGDLDGVEYLWVCDPIDGTANFVYGVPTCTVSICLAQRGKPVLGVIYDPSRDELFTGYRGGGVFVNGRPVRVRSDERLEEALIAMGFSTKPVERQKNVQAFLATLPNCRNIRNLGSAALHLAYVAAGRLTGFFEYGLSPWDLAAGQFLVTEAGGMATEVTGEAYTLKTSDMLATNGRIHAELIGRLAR